MVRSRLDNSIKYEEIKTLSQDDENMESDLFLTEVNDIKILCSIGKVKYTYVNKNILYVPLYLINDERVVSRIGLYEFSESELINVVDEKNELIDIEELNEPLLFSFVTTSFLKKYKYQGRETLKKEEIEEDEDTDKDTDEDEEQDTDEEDTDDDDEEDTDEEDTDEDDEEDTDEDEDEEQDTDEDDEEDSDKEDTDEQDTYDDDISIDDIQDKNDLEQYIEKAKTPSITEKDNYLETKEDSEKIKSQYKNGNIWVEEYFKNNKFNIIDNEGGGDCLFAVIRDAYKSIDVDMSVEKQRNILSENVTEELFNNYKTLHTDFSKEYKNLTKELKKLVKKNKEYKKEIENETNITKRKIILDKSKKNAEEFKNIKEQQNVIFSLLQDYQFMENINTIDDFKNIVKSCKFWGDAWSISILEQALNIKLIILSKEAYEQEDYNNVLLCGHMNDTELQKKKSFKPDFYIITDYNGIHYKLVSYNNKRILKYNQIPYDIRTMIVDKCLERGAGSYSFIPQFNTLKQRIEKKRENIEEIKPENKKKQYINATTKSDIEETEEKEETEKEKLYNEEIVFQFYIKSADKPPGKGSGETIPETKRKDFALLNKVKHWRRKLSNLYEEPFILEDKKWNSIEHYYQAMKFKKYHPEIYDMFSLESQSEISNDAKKAKDIGEKQSYKRKKLTIDESFNDNKNDILYRAYMAKFTQNKELEKILQETKNAKLHRYLRGYPPQEATILMKVRENI